MLRPQIIVENSLSHNFWFKKMTKNNITYSKSIFQTGFFFNNPKISILRKFIWRPQQCRIVEGCNAIDKKFKMASALKIM